MALKTKTPGGALALNASGKLSCACCCEPTCPSPVIQWDSRSASKTKYGFSEWAGYESSPPRIYSDVVISGTSHREYWDGAACGSSPPFTEEIYTFSGGGSLSRNAFATVDSANVTTRKIIKFSGVTDSDVTTTGGSPIGYISGASVYATIGTTDACGIATYTSTVATRQDSVNCADGVGANCTADVVSTISNEYDTATLKSNTTAALPAFPGTWTGTAGSYFNLTGDEKTNSIRESKYRFQFVIPEMCGETPCYKIEWSEDGTPKSWQWDGTGTAGDTAYSPEYTIPIPTTNKTATVTGITATCTGCV